MEYGFSIIMFILGVGLLLYGLHLYYSKDPFIPPRVEISMKKTLAYRRYLAKMVMFMSLCPIITGIVAFTNNEMAQHFSHRENMIMCLFFSFLVRTLILTLT